MREFYHDVAYILESLDIKIKRDGMEPKSDNSANAENSLLSEGDACPHCGGRLVLRHSERGDFLGCSNYPECSFMQPVAVRKTVRTILEISDKCPECGYPLEVKKGRFGIFIGCSNYPRCGYIYNNREDAGIPCPVCHKVEMERRQSRNGRVFYSCSNYPECKFTLPGKPVSEKCEECGFPVMFEKKVKAGIALVCGNSLCSSRRKRKKKIIRPN